VIDVRPLDAIVIAAYILAVIAVGFAFAGRRQTARDYFLGGRGLPWWAICFSIVATETSALTVISLPATAYQADFWFIQLALGYLVGRLAIAVFLLPRYFDGELITAYALLERRFGRLTRRFASIIFMVTRSLADSVRMFAAAIPVRLVTGVEYWQAIVVTGAITAAYTWVGGLRAVVWVDVAQLGIYLLGGVAALVTLLRVVPGGWDGVLAAAAPDAKFTFLHFDGGLADPQWILTGLVGGAFLSMASHGVDHLTVQRLLASRNLRDSRKAIIGSGFVVLLQFALFLFVGVALFAHYAGRTFETPDEIFPRFILEGLAPGLAGLVIAGILAAMMSTVSSSLNSLSSALANDVIGPITGKETDDEWMVRLGRRLTLFWALVLIGGALLFQFVQQGTPVVVIALQIASFTYGGLLGGFLLGLVSRTATERDALAGMGTALLLMAVLWASQQFGLMPRVVDTLWFAMIGSVITVSVGTASAAIRDSRRRPLP
jgi:SSS family solute:Na+ symporter